MNLFGLPLHPLVVHGAVVLLPLVAIGALVVVFSRRARDRYGSLVAVGSVLALGAVIASRVSGEALAGGLTASGSLGTHIAWGLLAPIPALLLAIGAVSLALTRSAGRVWQLSAAIVTVVAAAASLVVIVLVGHSGAAAVWG